MAVCSMTKADQYVYARMPESNYLNQFRSFYTQYTNDVKMYIFEKATNFTSGHNNSFAVALLFALFGLTKHLIPFPV